MSPLSALVRLSLTVLWLVPLVACATGPFSSQAFRQARAGAEYLETLRANLSVDDSFRWESLSSALIVRALPYNQVVRQAAESRFADDQIFLRETEAWLKPIKGQEPLVIIMGLFAPDLDDEDVTELGRFRPYLQGPDGRELRPESIERYGRDIALIRDHFPLFNPWEEVFVLRFAPVAEPAEFILRWPGGRQSLALP